jgi:hypothetical protein
MLAAEYDITLEKGATFEQTFKWTDKDGTAVDLTNLDFQCQIKLGRQGTIILEGSYEGSTNTPSGDIVIAEGGVAGTFSITLSRAVTRVLDFVNAYWYMEIANVLNTFRVIEGAVRLSRR